LLGVNQKIQLVELSIHPNRIDEARSLIQEYASSIGVSLCFQNFDQEMATLPGEYSPPSGALLLAENEGKPVGCVAIKKISEEVCEIKRLYVRPESRGKGIGKLLTESIIEKARNIGYTKVRLDTLPSMKEAISMYLGMGFKPIEAYRYNPVDGALYLELALSR
jgi:putative acetyltransferase